MTHTPGPWVFDGNCAGYIDQGGEHIARAYAADDAMLIAAAPDLLEALRWMVTYHEADKQPVVGYDEYLRRAREAIAKAEGA